MSTPPESHFYTRSSWFGHTPVMEIIGELDISSRENLREALIEAFEQGARRDGNLLVVDFTECSFMDSEGLKVFIETEKQLAEGSGTLKIVVPDFCSVAKTFEATSEYHGLTIYQNVAEAAKSSRSDPTST